MRILYCNSTASRSEMTQMSYCHLINKKIEITKQQPTLSLPEEIRDIIEKNFI